VSFLIKGVADPLPLSPFSASGVLEPPTPPSVKPAPPKEAACTPVKRTGQSQVLERGKRMTVCVGASLPFELVEQDPKSVMRPSVGRECNRLSVGRESKEGGDLNLIGRRDRRPRAQRSCHSSSRV
jgi:hypothetical protein